MRKQQICVSIPDDLNTRVQEYRKVVSLTTLVELALKSFLDRVEADPKQLEAMKKRKLVPVAVQLQVHEEQLRELQQTVEQLENRLDRIEDRLGMD